jgi:hypothetical protein
MLLEEVHDTHRAERYKTFRRVGMIGIDLLLGPGNTDSLIYPYQDPVGWPGETEYVSIV